MIKKNVGEFDKDVIENKGFVYTTNLKYSSIVSNKRISDEVSSRIQSGEITILDAGCGDGTYTQEIKDRFPQSKIVAVDPSNEGIKTAKIKYPHIDFLVMDIEDEKAFNGIKNIFDVTVIRGVLHHMNNPVKGIQNLNKITKKIIIVEPNGNNPILKLIEKTSKYHIAHEEQSFSSRRLKKWCTDSGFENIKIKYIGLVPFFFPTFISKIIHFFQPLVEKIPIINKYCCAQIVLTAGKAHD